MALLSNLFKNTIFQPIAAISNVFTLPFQILQSAIKSTVTLIDKIFDPFNLFDVNQLTSKDSVFKKIAELAQHDQALAQPAALRSSIINILNAKSGILGIPSTGITGIADKIQQALSGGKLFGTIDTIIKKVQNIFDFGTIFETPKAVIEKITDMISGNFSGGTLIDSIGKLIKSTADLFNLPSIDNVISKIQEYINLGVIFRGVANLLEKVEDIFNFGEILDTPLSIIKKLGELVLENVLKPALPIVEQIVQIINAKAELLGLPKVEDVVAKVLELINFESIVPELGRIIQSLKNIFEGKPDPVNPSDPSDPSNPTDPTDPTNPTDPSNPTLPNLNDTVKHPADIIMADLLEELTLDGNQATTVVGNALDNTINGNDGNNILYGLSGDDKIFANGGQENILVGGSGNDELYGGNGKETYVFEKGFGKDTILETGGDDTIKFGEGIEYANIRVLLDGSDRVIKLIDTGLETGDTITIQNWDEGDHRHVESIQFSNGDRLDLLTLEYQPGYY